MTLRIVVRVLSLLSLAVSSSWIGISPAHAGPQTRKPLYLFDMTSAGKFYVDTDMEGGDVRVYQGFLQDYGRRPDDPTKPRSSELRRLERNFEALTPEHILWTDSYPGTYEIFIRNGRLRLTLSQDGRIYEGTVPEGPLTPGNLLRKYGIDTENPANCVARPAPAEDQVSQFPRFSLERQVGWNYELEQAAKSIYVSIPGAKAHDDGSAQTETLWDAISRVMSDVPPSMRGYFLHQMREALEQYWRLRGESRAAVVSAQNYDRQRAAGTLSPGQFRVDRNTYWTYSGLGTSDDAITGVASARDERQSRAIHILGGMAYVTRAAVAERARIEAEAVKKAADCGGGVKTQQEE